MLGLAQWTGKMNLKMRNEQETLHLLHSIWNFILPSVSPCCQAYDDQNRESQQSSQDGNDDCQIKSETSHQNHLISFGLLTKWKHLTNQGWLFWNQLFSHCCISLYHYISKLLRQYICSAQRTAIHGVLQKCFYHYKLHSVHNHNK